MDNTLEKAKKIRLAIFDVDGILTSGITYYSKDGPELKGFHIHDGLGIKLLQKVGIQIAIISGKKSEAVLYRLKELEIEHIYLGHENKLPVYETLKAKTQFKDDEISYMGDDLIDLPLLCRVGFAITVPNVPEIMTEHVDYVTKHKGGKGAVREVCEIILQAQGKYQAIIQHFLPK